MKWTKLIVSIHPMAVEATANLMMELGIEGVEIDDQFLSDADKEAMYAHYVDDSIMPRDEYRVIVYLDDTTDALALKAQVETGLIRIKEFLEVGSGSIQIEEMPDEDYENKWKEFYKSFRVGEHLIITPIWEEIDSREDDMVVRIDPGLAFGSGTHETTSLCIEYLIEHDWQDKTVVDVGCGSGILGITAAMLGAKRVQGIDIDENAIDIAKENVATNNVDEIMSIHQGNLLDEVDGQVDLVLANIMADIIMMISKDVKEILRSGGTFVASGIILDMIEPTKAALIDAGFEHTEVRTNGEWAAIIAS